MGTLLLLVSVTLVTVVYGYVFKLIAKKINLEIITPTKSKWWHKLLAILAAMAMGMVTGLLVGTSMFGESAKSMDKALGNDIGGLLALMLIWIPMVVSCSVVGLFGTIPILASAAVLEYHKIGNRKWLTAILILTCCDLLQPHTVSLYDLTVIAPAVVCALVCNYFEDKVRVENA